MIHGERLGERIPLQRIFFNINIIIACYAEMRKQRALHKRCKTLHKHKVIIFILVCLKDDSVYLQI